MIFASQDLAQFYADRPKPVSGFNSPQVRVLIFGLEAGQQVPPHSSPATVVLTVISGRGQFAFGEQQHEVEPGYTGICAPGQIHSFTAAERMIVQAVIIPS